MDDEAREHLYRLAGTAPDGERPQPRETVTPALRQLLDGYPNAAAFVLNPATDFLAANALADALFSAFGTRDNMARMTFLDPAARTFFTQWGRAAEAVVAVTGRAVVPQQAGCDARAPAKSTHPHVPAASLHPWVPHTCRTGQLVRSAGGLCSAVVAQPARKASACAERERGSAV